MKNLIGTAVVAVSLSVSGWAVGAEQCKQQAAELGASYTIETKIRKFDHSVSQLYSYMDDVTERNVELEIWRHNGLVAHVHPTDNIAEIWNQVRDGRVRPIRYFDADQRAIEYAPEDVNRGKGDHDWQGKNQLFTDAYIASLEKVSEQGSGCERTVTYQQKDDKGETTLVWMPELKLPQSFDSVLGKRETRWTLNKVVNDPQAVEQVFESRERYLSTDYADIGDNETDPFFRNLINLGFVSHGASGFYNADGQDIGAGHRH